MPAFCEAGYCAPFSAFLIFFIFFLDKQPLDEYNNMRRKESGPVLGICIVVVR